MQMGGLPRTVTKDMISNAKSWLRRARLDYDGFERVVGRHYLRSKATQPHDPALSLYLIAQAVEKAVKSIAVASGVFEEDALMYEYSHNSLKLYLDFYLRVLDLPLAAVLSIMPSLGMPMPSIADARAKLKEIRQNTLGRKQRFIEAPNWWLEYATLSPGTVGKLVSILISIRQVGLATIHKRLRGRSRTNLAKIENYLDNPSLENLQGVLSSAFYGGDLKESELDGAATIIRNMTGHDFSELLKLARDKEKAVQAPASKAIKREDVDKVFLSAWAVAGLLVLSALTFPHQASIRYPSHKLRAATKLDCESYTEELGVVAHLRGVGHVTKMALVDMESALSTVAFTFSYYAERSCSP